MAVAARHVSGGLLILACLVALVHQIPISADKSEALFRPHCFRDAYYFDVRCLALLWDVSRHPAFGENTERDVSPSQQPKQDEEDDDDKKGHKSWSRGTHSRGDEKKRVKMCEGKRLIDCPKYKDVIREDFTASDIECSPIRACHSEVTRFMDKCAVDERVRLVSNAL